MPSNEYAQSGVDYTKIQRFKDRMIEIGKETLDLPLKRRRVLVERGDHGCLYQYLGAERIKWGSTQEGLGNKNWISEWMYEFSGTRLTYYNRIGWDAALMAVNDLIAQGVLPALYLDEVAAGDSEWFEDDQRAADLAEGYLEICKEVGMALPAGESPSLRYLVNSLPPVKSCPTLSGSAIGVVNPQTRSIAGELRVGDRIIGAPSTGLHCNGISLVIKRAMDLPEQLLTRLPNGNTLGEEALIPTRSYVGLIEALLEEEIDIRSLIPGTGNGVSKLAFDQRPFTYRLKAWPEVPSLFLFMRELGVNLKDCLKTFNWGVGYYIIIPSSEVYRTIEIGKKAGYELLEVGIIEEGPRQVIFEPEGIILEPPGE